MKSNKKSVVIGILCIALVFMGIGYSILSSTLNITGTAKASGSFNVQITNVTMKDKSSGATDQTEYPGYSQDGTTANLIVDFNEPGDYITYTIEVSNLGTIDAIVKAAVKGAGTNDEYFDMTCKLNQPRELLVGKKTTFDCIISYDKDSTMLVDSNIRANMFVIVEAVQKSSSNIVVQDFEPLFLINSDGAIIGYNGGSDVVIPESYPEAIITSSDFDMTACIPFVMDEEGVAEQEAEEMCNDVKATFEDGTINKDVLQYLIATNVINIKYEQGSNVTITEIAPYAFAGSEVTSLDLSSATNLKKIGQAAFINHKLSGVITIPANVEEIGDQAFARAQVDSENIVTGLTFASGSRLKSIGYAAFHSVGIGGTLVIPANVETIGLQAFEVNNFTTVDLSGATSLKTIGNSAFNLNKLTGSLVIPSNLISIGEHAFAGSGTTQNQISSLTFASGSHLQTIGSHAFVNNQISGVLSIPDSVTNIDVRAFRNNNIQTLNLGSSLSSLNTLDSEAFSGNPLTTVNIKMPLATWNSRSLPNPETWAKSASVNFNS